MRAIRGRDTGPELTLRRALHAAGLRYRLHQRGLPGRPDLVFPRFRAVVFVHGCFWHMHGCHAFKIPETRQDFWIAKLEGNRVRDVDQRSQLAAMRWRVGVVWECAIAGKYRRSIDEVVGHVHSWLESEELSLTLSGRPPGP